jgi:MFS family permease
VLAKAIGFLAFGLMTPLGLQVITVGLHHAPSFIGVTISVQSVFGVAGAAVAGRLARRVGDASLMTLGLALFAAACPLLAIPSTLVALGAIALLGCSVPWFLIGSSTILQKATPLDLVGRVSGANSLAVMTPQALGNMIGAALVIALPYRLLAVLLAVMLASTTFYCASRPALRRSRGVDVAPAAPSAT